MAGPPPQFDWFKGQSMYESGVCSIRQIAKALGCSDAAVSNRASRYGWTRDPLGVAKLQDERARMVAAATQESRDKVIAITASMQSQVLVGHRKDIARARKLVSVLLDELTGLSDPAAQENLENLGDLLANPDERGNLDKLNRVYTKVISMPERIAGINGLSTALKTLIMLERQAYHIEGALVDPEATKAPDEVVKGLDAIMDKFNMVLGMQVQVPEPLADTPLIIDVAAPHGSPVNVP